MMRIAGLIFGLPVLLLGSLLIGNDVAGLIREAMSPDPNFIHVPPYPLGVLCGAPLFYLGYRLVFSRFNLRGTKDNERLGTKTPDLHKNSDGCTKTRDGRVRSLD